MNSRLRSARQKGPTLNHTAAATAILDSDVTTSLLLPTAVNERCHRNASAAVTAMKRAVPQHLCCSQRNKEVRRIVSAAHNSCYIGAGTESATPPLTLALRTRLERCSPPHALALPGVIAVYTTAAATTRVGMAQARRIRQPPPTPRSRLKLPVSR